MNFLLKPFPWCPDTNLLNALIAIAFWATFQWIACSGYIEDLKHGSSFGTNNMEVAIQEAMDNATQTVIG